MRNIGPSPQKRRGFPNLLVMLVITLLLLSACGGTSTTTTQPTAAGNGQAPGATTAAEPAGNAQAGAPVTIKWMIWSDDIGNEKNLQNEIKMYNDSQQEIKVELIGAPWNDFTPKLQTMLASNTLPDVISIQSEADYVSKGLMLPLEDLIKKDNLDMNRFVPGAIQPAYDGKIYGLRHDAAAWLLFYNKDMFEQAGMPTPPATGWTIDQFMDAACKLSKPEQTQWGMHNLNWVMEFLIRGQGMPYLEMVGEAPKYQIDDPKTLAFYQKVGDFINKQNCQPNADQNQSLGGSDPFLAGRAAMSLNGNWAFGNVKENAKFNWDVAPIPGLKQTNFGMKIGIGKTSKNQEAAWKFLKWLTYEPEATRYRSEKGMGMPAINDQQAIDTFLKGASAPPSLPEVYKVLSNKENTLPVVEFPGMSEANNIITPATDEVMNGLAPATQAIPPAVSKANDVLAKEWQKVASK